MPWSIFTQGGGNGVAVSWAESLLTALHAPLTPSNIQFVYDWEKSEGGGGKYNPLNQGPVPGQPGLTTTGSQYGGGAADFASWEAGLEGSVAYLNMPAYAGIKNALLVGNGDAARSALIASPWAGGHYGGGSAWNTSPVPGGIAGQILAIPSSSTSTATGGQSATLLASVTSPAQFIGGAGHLAELLVGIGLVFFGVYVIVTDLTHTTPIRTGVKGAVKGAAAAGAAAVAL